ncbi:MAG: tRNA (guanosine(37)-N1)-methyltransferase TrmD [Planctomycetaceae bacterium]|nr:tRNA (guanosine(37)-N1)-methyltransferase TrmD [Planctomycetaceae bacterium]MCP4461993.1 tRNA (guanosine(37)-N1)-methyltransferase TrmD [Planctomycetaceae bacterium]MDG1810098.1 tRNA (guanosine(37)-N1)-methyltransferase TrmD [Pirellulaceae bacterium]MDG2104741.1 tRNA (guanosine(37)-N1)-methyltransferase TrmD [Pirellulaceae bacterium]
MRFDILTLFPDMFPGYLGQSLLNKAIQKGIVDVQVHDLRMWTKGTHRKVDDRPYGGGPGMIIMVEPVVDAVEAIQKLDDTPAQVVMTTPQGTRLNQKLVEDLAVQQRFLLLCGRYEGFDQRVIDVLKPLEISIGDYILNGGEVASMVMVDTLVRMVPGVLGHEESSIQDSFSRGNRMLEYPQYTRPRDYRGLPVPEILLSGNHPEIEKWRAAQSLLRTQQRRADLLDEKDNSGQ